MAKQSLEQLRERAKTDLRILFNVDGEAPESLILFMIGLYESNVDVVQVAIDLGNIGRIPDSALRSHPSFSEAEEIDDYEREDSEEEKAVKRWGRFSR